MMVNKDKKEESELCKSSHFLIDKPIEYFFKYFPARIRNVGEDAVNARELIWAFKDAEADVFEEVAQIVADHLIEKFGEKRLMNMSFVCVPPSSKEAYANRYFNFCNRVEELTGIGNGFSHVCLLKSRKASHEHKRGKKKEDIDLQPINIDKDYFAGKEVCVFDDVITTGKSYARFASMLEDCGANVVNGVFLGKTFYRYDE